MIETARLRLEPLVVGHAEVMFPVLSDEAIYAYIDDVPPVDLAALQARYAVLAGGGSRDGREVWLNWILIEKMTGNAIGYFQATIRAEECLIAYALNSRFWRQGFAGEAGKAVLDYLIWQRGTAVIRAEIAAGNEASKQLARRLGLRFLRKNEEADEEVFELRA